MTDSTSSQAYKLLCRSLVKARTEAGLTQEEVAAALGRPQSFVSKYERGERRLDLVELVEVGQVVQLDFHGLIRQVKSAVAAERRASA